MSFFKSEVVRLEMIEISKLQEKIYENVFDFYKMSYEQKLEHIELLQELLNRQRILYTRISLSDDPDAIDMKNRIIESAIMMGLPENVDMNVIFGNMDKLIEKMKKMT